MSRVVLRVWVPCWLAAVWMLLWGDVSAANLLAGLALALIVTTLLPLPRVPVRGRVRPLALLRLVLTVAYLLVVSSVQVAWLAVRPGPVPAAAILRAPLNLESDLVLALAVNVINLIPGSVVLEIDQTRRLIYAHVIDAGSPRAVERFRAQIAQVERLTRAAFLGDADAVAAPVGEAGR